MWVKRPSISENIINSLWLTDLEDGYIGFTSGSEKQLESPGLSARFTKLIVCLVELSARGRSV